MKLGLYAWLFAHDLDSSTSHSANCRDVCNRHPWLKSNQIGYAQYHILLLAFFRVGLEAEIIW